MKKLLPAICLLIIGAGTFAQTKQTITHESLWLMKRVGAPEVSPDGRWVVFSVNEPAYDDKDAMTDLWLVPANGSAKPRRITSTKAGEAGYKWSPDSKQIAFSAKRDADEAGQIYILNVIDGGEAQRLTNLSTGAGSPSWSPDGKMIAFTSNVYPGAFSDSANKKIAEERKKVKYKARVYTSYPIRYWDQWLDDKQTHIFVQSTQPGSLAKDLFTSAPMVAMEGFNFGGALNWSNDGSQIIFAATTDFDKAISVDVISNLYSISSGGGAIKQLTSDGADYASAKVSSDGKYLLAMATAANNYKVYNTGQLVRFSWPSMQNKTNLTASLDRPISDYELSGSKAYISAEDQGKDKLFVVDFATPSITNLSAGSKGSLTSLSISNDASVVVSNYEDAGMPAEVVRVQPGVTTYTYLSDFNTARVQSLDLPEGETFWFKSSRGKQIRSMLIKPAGFDPTKKYPLFVVMHGGPAGSWKENWSYRWNYHLLAAPGYIVLLTDYTGSTGYGDRFAQDIQYDPFRGPANEINEAAKEAIKRYTFIDGSRQAAGGASYGGHLANWMEATTTHYKCLISHAGLVNSEAQYGTSDGNYGREVMAGGVPWLQTKTWKEQNPIRFAANFKTPMLVTVGELDYRVPLNNSLENWAALQRQKVPSKLIIFPEENHWILKAENSRFFYQEVHAWLKKYL